MIHRFVKIHPFYKANNATVCAQFVIATLVSQYDSTIADFKIAKSGCGAINALKAQFSGNAHWDREMKLQMNFLLDGKWNVQKVITLYTFLSKHRASFYSFQ